MGNADGFSGIATARRARIWLVAHVASVGASLFRTRGTIVVARAHVASVDGEFLEQLSVFISGTISFHREGHRHQKHQSRQKVHPYVFDVNLKSGVEPMYFFGPK